MMKKILATLLGLSFVFSLTACGEQESEYIEYTVTQASQKVDVAYGGQNLTATEIEFAKQETPEKMFATFGEAETGKTDVEFLDRVQIIDGKVVVGLSVGEKPRMAGIYVQGFGYYFINAETLNGEHAVSLKNVPYGTYQLTAFSVIEDDVMLGSNYLTFTREKALLLEGETEGEFTLESGKMELTAQKYQAVSDFAFVLSKNSLLDLGEVAAKVQGNAGIALGVNGVVTGDVSQANYVYAGIKDGKATIIDYRLNVPTVLSEKAIDGYDATAEYEIGAYVKAVNTGDDAERQTQIVLFINGDAAVTVDKTLESNQNVGFVCLSSSSSVGSVSIPPCSLDDYKAYAKSRFESLVKVELYTEKITGIATSYIETESKNYNDADKYMFVAREYKKAVNAIENATDISSAVTLYSKYYATINAEVLDVYKEDIESSLKSLSSNWYSIVNFEGDVTNYTVQDNVPAGGDGTNDVAITYVGGAQESFNLGVEGIDLQTWDYRWWIPLPFRVPNLLASAHTAIAESNYKDGLKVIYERYYEEILRSVCQKVMEEYHAIKHIEDDGFLWGYNWNYCGDNTGSIYTFVYDGPVREYKGVTYGVSNETVFRLSPLLYKPGERGEGLFGDRGIVALFNYAMHHFKNFKTVGDIV